MAHSPIEGGAVDPAQVSPAAPALPAAAKPADWRRSGKIALKLFGAGVGAGVLAVVLTFALPAKVVAVFLGIATALFVAKARADVLRRVDALAAASLERTARRSRGRTSARPPSASA
jgi:hypothetical protein